MSKEAMNLALEALEYIEHNYMSLPAPAEKAITALREALAEQPAPVAKPHEQEPVAWRYTDARGHYRYRGFVANFDKKYPMLKPQPLYTSPIAQQEPFQNNPFDCGVYLGSGKDHVIKHHVSYGPAQQEPVAWKLVPREPTHEMLKAMDECSTEGYDERLYAGHAASVYMAAVDAAPTPPAQPQQEPVVWMYVNKSTHETKFQKHMRDFVDHSLWSEVPLYGEPLANHEFQCVCGAVWCGDEMVHLPDKRPPAQRKPLTDEEIILIVADCASSHQHTDIHFARAIEAKLKEKNNG